VLNHRSIIWVALAGILIVGLANSCKLARTKSSEAKNSAPFTSNLLGISFKYQSDQFTEVIENNMAEFPLTLKGKDYDVGIKSLKGVAPTLARAPGRDFFLFFSGEIVRGFSEDHKMKLLEPERIQEFTAKGKPLAMQFLHYKLPEQKDLIPSFIPQDASEIYLYYFHFVFPPDYWNFVAISKRKLTDTEVQSIVTFIENVKFPGEANR